MIFTDIFSIQINDLVIIMELTEIIMDSIIYPTQNIKALAIYLLIGIIVGVVAFATGASSVFASVLTGAKHGINGAGIIVLLIGIILLLALYCFVQGYGMDIIKTGILRTQEAPGIDFERQLTNGFNCLIVTIVYMIIPLVLTYIIGLFLRSWLTMIIALILFVIFMFAMTMAQCRLADTNNLGYALNVQGAISDMQNIGVPKVVMTIVAILLVDMVIQLIVGGIFGLFGSQMLTSMITSLVSIYLIFYQNRAVGLLYSEKR